MYKVAQNIRQAETLPTEFYQDKISFKKYTDTLISNSWQFLGDDNIFSNGENAVPLDLMTGIIDEPIVLIKDGEKIICLSNVCTHRGN